MRFANVHQRLLTVIRQALVGLCACVLIQVASVRVVAQQEEGTGLHAFFLHYLIVSNLKETDNSKWDTFKQFREASPKAANSLAEFWWSWGIRQCMPYLTDQITQVSKIPDQKLRDEAMKQVESTRDNCIEAFIFDRWNDINKSIETKFARFPKDNN